MILLVLYQQRLSWCLCFHRNQSGQQAGQPSVHQPAPPQAGGGGAPPAGGRRPRVAAGGRRAGLRGWAAGPVWARRSPRPHAPLGLGPEGGFYPGTAVFCTGSHWAARRGGGPELPHAGRFCGLTLRDSVEELSFQREAVWYQHLRLRSWF